MGFLDSLKKGLGFSQEQPQQPAIILGAPAKGTVLVMADIPDEAFSQGFLGFCCAVDPADGKVYSPIDGKITQLPDSLHAVGMEAEGMELLIHCGVDTVEMKGDGFTGAVSMDQTVKKGDLLLTMDLDKIRAAGHPAAIIMAVTNSDDLGSAEMVTTNPVEVGADLIRVTKK